MIIHIQNNKNYSVLISKKYEIMIETQSVKNTARNGVDVKLSD